MNPVWSVVYSIYHVIRLCIDAEQKANYAYVSSLRDASNTPVPVDGLVCLMLPRSYRYRKPFSTPLALKLTVNPDGLRYTSAYASLSNAKYLRKDFNAMMKKVTLIQVLIDHQVPMLAELFEGYKVALMAHVMKVQQASTVVVNSSFNDLKLDQASDMANSWATEVFRLCSTEYDTALRKTAERSVCQLSLE